MLKGAKNPSLSTYTFHPLRWGHNKATNEKKQPRSEAEKSFKVKIPISYFYVDSQPSRDRRTHTEMNAKDDAK